MGDVACPAYSAEPHSRMDLELLFDWDKLSKDERNRPAERLNTQNRALAQSPTAPTTRSKSNRCTPTSAFHHKRDHRRPGFLGSSTPDFDREFSLPGQPFTNSRCQCRESCGGESGRLLCRSRRLPATTCSTWPAELMRITQRAYGKALQDNDVHASLQDDDIGAIQKVVREEMQNVNIGGVFREKLHVPIQSRIRTEHIHASIEETSAPDELPRNYSW
ncbi:hypothetical protein F4679DRAFT_589560 [Xylaria curta]|nr:hypothetical protein F4679DRAFT_589560 [Xylaria curta]